MILQHCLIFLKPFWHNQRTENSYTFATFSYILLWCAKLKVDNAIFPGVIVYTTDTLMYKNPLITASNQI